MVNNSKYEKLTGCARRKMTLGYTWREEACNVDLIAELMNQDCSNFSRKNHYVLATGFNDSTMWCVDKLNTSYLVHSGQLLNPL